MFAAENLRDWLAHNVIDPEGNKIGTLEAVYVDTISDQPSFVTVEVGMIGRRRLVLVPVAGATVSPKAAGAVPQETGPGRPIDRHRRGTGRRH